ncbi:acyl-ACP thioesterase [Candidatus Moduliflexus flocculans]|uniref:Acyl-ACP thioesterase n=1 Tax=Candidatus Moduliflexus flocculans TaxID=1499966 RepID=A0A0S6VZV7_9BACT|nr:acyl-ACP thioesterase [Candidatus Moduliflexus flocculans]
MPTPIWNEWFQIHSYQTDFRSKATIQTLCRFLQETAGNHARDLGFSVESLQQQGLTWMLSRFHVQIERYPAWQERVRVETWPAQAIGFYGIRDFFYFDEQDRLLAKASSIWLIIELARKTPIRLPDNILGVHKTDRPRAIDDRFDTLWRPSQGQIEKRFDVRHSDIDLNQHVNNVSYVEWAVETISDDLWRSAELTELEVSFRAEALTGDTIISQSEQTADNDRQTVLHRVLRASDKLELFLARTRWREQS